MSVKEQALASMSPDRRTSRLQQKKKDELALSFQQIPIDKSQDELRMLMTSAAQQLTANVKNLLVLENNTTKGS